MTQEGDTLPSLPSSDESLFNPCAVKRRWLGRNLSVLVLKHERRVQWGSAAVLYTRLTVR